MTTLYYYMTSIGKIGLMGNEQALTQLFFDGESPQTQVVEKETALLKETHRQLTAYLDGSLQAFTVPLTPEGTDYMKRAWNCLCDIPYGQTRSYQEIAQILGNPRAARAVGLANNKNPIPIFIPCHRVIGASGKLTGYRGGLELKARLLELEKRNARI